MLIRRYTPKDFQAIAEIYNEAIVQGAITMDCVPQSAEDVRSLAEKFHHRETILMAEQDNRIVGWGIIKRYSNRPGYDFCCETSTYLTLGETRRGYGSQLQKALLQQVMVFGYHHVVAKILADNQGSIAFHQRFGFEIVGIQKEIGFLKGEWRDVVILQLILPKN